MLKSSTSVKLTWTLSLNPLKTSLIKYNEDDDGYKLIARVGSLPHTTFFSCLLCACVYIGGSVPGCVRVCLCVVTVRVHTIWDYLLRLNLKVMGSKESGWIRTSRRQHYRMLVHILLYNIYGTHYCSWNLVLKTEFGEDLPILPNWILLVSWIGHPCPNGSEILLDPGVISGLFWIIIIIISGLFCVLVQSILPQRYNTFSLCHYSPPETGQKPTKKKKQKQAGKEKEEGKKACISWELILSQNFCWVKHNSTKLRCFLHPHRGQPLNYNHFFFPRGRLVCGRWLW